MPARAAIDRAGHGATRSRSSTTSSSGDRDSLGLFQQRPSQGWGTRGADPRTPYYATNAFYDALARVDGYETMPITVAAQAVQRSGLPRGVRRPRGRRPGARLGAHRQLAARVQLRRGGRRAARARPARRGRADPPGRAVRRDLVAAFGDLSLGGFAPGGVTTGHMEGSAHYEGRAIDVFVRPIDAGQPTPRLGDRAVPRRPGRPARHPDRHLRRPDLDRRGPLGQRLARLRRAPSGPGDPAVLEHRDHVHVDVFD